MAKLVPSTILLKGEDVGVVQHETAAGGTITPGHLVMLNSSGALVVHGTAAGTIAEKAFALEDDAQGKGITDNYTSGNRARYMICAPGTEVYAWVEAGTTVAVGGALESAGDGTLQARTTGQAVGVSLEALNAVAAATRCRIRVV